MASLNATAIELLLRFQRLLVGMLYPPSEEHRCSPEDFPPDRRPSKLNPNTLAAGSLLRKYTVLLVSHVAGNCVAVFLQSSLLVNTFFKFVMGVVISQNSSVWLTPLVSPLSVCL